MKIKIPNNDKPGVYWISGGCTYQSFGGVLIQAKEKISGLFKEIKTNLENF